MEKKPDFYTNALEEYDRVFSGDGAPRPFAEMRRRGRDAFQALGLPTRKDEAWKYTDVRKAIPAGATFGERTALRITREDVASHVIPGLDARTLVVVNGIFEPALSDLGDLGKVIITSLRNAADNQHEIMRTHFGRYAEVDDRSFVALNSAFDLDGVFLYVPDGIVLDKPIRILHLLDSEKEAIVQSRHLFVFGDNSQACLVESHLARTEIPNSFGNHVTEIFVGDDAVIDHYRIQDEGANAAQVNTTQVIQKDRAVFSTATFTFASGLVRNDLTVVADGEHGETNLGGLYIARGDQHIDNHTLVDHAKPGCSSNELYKGIIYDQATGVFNGKVMVRRDAQQTNAYQQSQGVVLSDDADHYSKPELEIYADDVKCSHGSTTGEIDRDALFYCRARGISLDDARSILLYAFAHDVVEQVKLKPVRDWLDVRIDERLD